MRYFSSCCYLLSLTVVVVQSSISSRRRYPHALPLHSKPPPSDCRELYFTQRINHFGPTSSDTTDTFQQRYYISDASYQPGGPLFFYLGNEADVTLYVNATGLMWENAPALNALVVFAEHRYYGKSQVAHTNDTNSMQYLSSEQALMDYVTLIDHLKKQYDGFDDDSAAVIGFGGSYGGMLATWARLRYPHVWDGVIAGSAPVLPFEGLENYFDANFFAQGVTYDVTPAAGASKYCETNLRKAFADKALANADPNLIRKAFKVCPQDNDTDAELGWTATYWLNSALAYMAMGNFPYPSSYILNGDGVLPAFPVRVACESLATDLTGDHQLEEWLEGLAAFASVYYNASATISNDDDDDDDTPPRSTCNHMTAPVNNESMLVEHLWDYQYCTDLFMIGGQGPDKYDMYWDEPWDPNATAWRCFEEWGIWPDTDRIYLTYGTPDDWAQHASNIVWSQGEYDPWRGGGINENLTGSLIAVVIAEAAHHLDLFYSHVNDTVAVVRARELHVREMERWILEKKEKTRNNAAATKTS